MARMLDDRRRDKSLSAYAASKLGLLQFTEALRNVGVDARACHPGLVWTSMLQGFFPAPVRAVLPRRLFKTPAEGAATVLLACVDDEAGTYYMDSGDRPAAASPECSATGALVDELGALGLNIR